MHINVGKEIAMYMFSLQRNMKRNLCLSKLRAPQMFCDCQRMFGGWLDGVAINSIEGWLRHRSGNQLNWKQSQLKYNKDSFPSQSTVNSASVIVVNRRCCSASPNPRLDQSLTVRQTRNITLYWKSPWKDKIYRRHAEVGVEGQTLRRASSRVTPKLATHDDGSFRLILIGLNLTSSNFPSTKDKFDIVCKYKKTKTILISRHCSLLNFIK